MYVQKSLKCKINIKVSFAVQRVAENLGEIPRESQLVSERPRQFVTSQTVTDSPNKELMAGRNNWQFYFTQDINALMLFVISTYQDMCTSTITYKCARIQNSIISREESRQLLAFIVMRMAIMITISKNRYGQERAQIYTCYQHECITGNEY